MILPSLPNLILRQPLLCSQKKNSFVQWHLWTPATIRRCNYSTSCPGLTGKSAFGDLQRAHFTMPARLRGLCVPSPMVTAPIEFSASSKILAPFLCDCVSNGWHNRAGFKHLLSKCNGCKILGQSWSEEREVSQTTVASQLSVCPSLEQALDTAKVIGSSSWFASLPIETHGFSHYKGVFHDIHCNMSENGW